MQRSTALMGPMIGLALVALPLAGCVSDGYGTGYNAEIAWTNSPYDVWYDNYYGSIYDGYWGGDGYFYYRSGANDRNYHRGGRDHFRHDRGNNNYHRYQGSTHRPPPGTRMPHYRHNGDGGGHRGNGGNRGNGGHNHGRR